MSFKKILLPIYAEMDISQLAEFAFTLASQNNSRVEGIFLQPDYAQDFWLDNFGLPEHEIAELEKKAERKTREIERTSRDAFLACAGTHKKVEAKFISMVRQPISSFIDYSFCADLTVLENTTKHRSKHWQHLVKQVLGQSARPVFMAPANPVSKKLGSRIVIAWKHAPEASRAIAAAVPLIEKAKNVEIISIDEPQGQELRNALKDYVSLYAKNVKVTSLKADDEAIGRLLIDKTAEEDGSVLVMGAYSHSRLRERVFGGTTEYVLHNADVPVLMMH